MSEGGYLPVVKVHARKGDWIQTFTGGQFWALDPREEEINLIDIAAALSKLCRYGGHCKRFYSVAEHCVLMARMVRPDLRREALLHDASEAYLVDIPRPIKGSLGNYVEIEHGLMTVIARKYGFSWPVHAEVKAADNAMLHDEMLQNMAAPPARWHQIEGDPLGVTLQFWSPELAMQQFLLAAHEYGVAR